MSTTSSTTSHPLSFTLSTAAHFTISTTNPTLTLWYQPTTTTLSIPITPPLNTSYNTSSSPVNPNLPSTTTAKSKTTPSDTQSKHLPFTFLFIPNHPNYISKLKLPVNLAKLCTEIQRNVQLSIIKIVEEHLTKQNKRKNDETRKKKVHNFKPRFQPMNTHLLYLPILILRLISPPSHKTCTKVSKSTCPPPSHNTPNQSSKPQPHNTLIQPSKQQPHNMLYQPP